MWVPSLQVIEAESDAEPGPKCLHLKLPGSEFGLAVSVLQSGIDFPCNDGKRSKPPKLDRKHFLLKPEWGPWKSLLKKSDFEHPWSLGAAIAEGMRDTKCVVDNVPTTMSDATITIIQNVLFILSR